MEEEKEVEQESRRRRRMEEEEEENIGWRTGIIGLAPSVFKQRTVGISQFWRPMLQERTWIFIVHRE